MSIEDSDSPAPRRGHRKKDRTLVRQPKPTPLTPETLRVVFADDSRSWDFSSLGLPADLAAALADAFRSHHGRSTHEMRKTVWGALKTFSRFVTEHGGVHEAADLTTQTLNAYAAWLDARGGAKATRYHRFNSVSKLIRWVQKNRPGVLGDVVIPHNPFPNKNASAEPKAALTKEDNQAIARALQHEIDRAVRDFRYGQEILARRPAQPPALDGHLETLLWHLAPLAERQMLTEDACREVGIPKDRFQEQGGLRHLRRYFHLTPETLTAFYLEIVRQNSANADSIRHIDLDCTHGNPLDDNWRVFTWHKNRNGHVQKGTQPHRATHDVRKKHSTPNLVDIIAEMTAPYRASADASERDKLFLMLSYEGAPKERGRRAAKPGIPSNKALANHRDAIIARHNLPPFTADQFHATGIVQEYKESGGDVIRASQRAGHASVGTTDHYLRRREVTEQNRGTIRRLQHDLIAFIKDGRPEVGADTNPEAVRDHVDAAPATALGFTCLNPLAGVGPGSRKGELCPHFLGCLGCPGLVVQVEEKTLAKLLHAKDHFEACRPRLDPERWRVVYQPLYAGLCDIIDRFPEDMHAPARERAATLPELPELS